MNVSFSPIVQLFVFKTSEQVIATFGRKKEDIEEKINRIEMQVENSSCNSLDICILSLWIYIVSVHLF